MSEYQRATDRLGNYNAVAALFGYTAASVWGHFTFTGDLPWGTMTLTMFLACLPVAVLIGRRSQGEQGWSLWPSVALMFVASTGATFVGVLIGT